MRLKFVPLDLNSAKLILFRMPLSPTPKAYEVSLDM